MQQVMHESTEFASSLMFSAMYKFQYPAGVAARNLVMTPALTHRTEQPIVAVPPEPTMDFSFDYLLPMDSGFPDLMGAGNGVNDYCDFSSVGTKADWSLSPSVTLGPAFGQSSPGLSYDDDSDGLLSPSSACFPPGFENYVSHSTSLLLAPLS